MIPRAAPRRGVPCGTDNHTSYLDRVGSAPRAALTELACLGSTADVATPTIVRDTPAAQVHADLWDALRLKLIVRAGSSYAFVHDRVQEAAYSPVPEASRAGVHLRLGRRLLAAWVPVRRQRALTEAFA